MLVKKKYDNYFKRNTERQLNYSVIAEYWKSSSYNNENRNSKSMMFSMKHCLIMIFKIHLRNHNPKNIKFYKQKRHE